jgi:hypothetical protein
MFGRGRAFEADGDGAAKCKYLSLNNIKQPEPCENMELAMGVRPLSA